MSGPTITLSALDNTLSVAEKVISRRAILSPSRTEYCPGWTEFSLKRREFSLARTEFPPPWRDFTPELTEFPPEVTEFPPVRRELPPRAKMALLQRKRPFSARKMVHPRRMCSPLMPTGLYPERRFLVRRLRRFTQMQCVPSVQNGTKRYQADCARCPLNLRKSAQSADNNRGVRVKLLLAGTQPIR